MKTLIMILLLATLSSCATLEELTSFEEKPYQSPRAKKLQIDQSFTYESIRQEKIAFINLNFTAPRPGRGIDIDDEIGAPIPPYTYRFHEYLQEHRADIQWLGPRDLYYKLGHKNYIRMHGEFTNASDRLQHWLDVIKNTKNIDARYVATADRLLDDYSFAEVKDGYRYNRREMIVRLDIFDTLTSVRVWSGAISRSTNERNGHNSELWFFRYIALDLVNNLPTADAQIPIQEY